MGGLLLYGEGEALFANKRKRNSKQYIIDRSKKNENKKKLHQSEGNTHAGGAIKYHGNGKNLKGNTIIMGRRVTCESLLVEKSLGRVMLLLPKMKRNEMLRHSFLHKRKNLFLQ